MVNDNFISVTVKWTKKSFPDIEIDTTEPPSVFKSQLWTLTGVPPERQTILGFKGGKLKDDSDWKILQPRPNMKLTLIGTPDESRLAPPTKLPSVRDDLDVDANDPSYQPLPIGPPGLVNLGNTCYMNATIQCLHAVTPLETALTEYRGSTNALNSAEKLTASLRDVFSRLKSANTEKINPTTFLAVLRQVHPQFAERRENGFFMQQDAEECWGELLTRMASTLKLSNGDANHIDNLFSYHMNYVDRCDESDEVISRKENLRALKCHISNSVNHLRQGILEGLSEPIEKRSDQLDRSAKWTRTSRMNSLPPFLVVQFVRFYWKSAEAVKAKILRRVSFPVVLDVFDFCTEKLQKKLSVKRDELSAKSGPSSSASASATATDSSTAMETDVTTNEPSADAAGAADEAKGDSSNEASDDDDVLATQTGNYELCAVLTHRGRAADAGHYVAWVKDKDTRWFLFDDDKVSVHTEEDLKKLHGGGDWHMAYICLYRAKND